MRYLDIIDHLVRECANNKLTNKCILSIFRLDNRFCLFSFYASVSNIFAKFINLIGAIYINYNNTWLKSIFYFLYLICVCFLISILKNDMYKKNPLYRLSQFNDRNF